MVEIFFELRRFTLKQIQYDRDRRTKLLLLYIPISLTNRGPFLISNDLDLVIYLKTPFEEQSTSLICSAYVHCCTCLVNTSQRSRQRQYFFNETLFEKKLIKGNECCISLFSDT